ncbi:hypothetical protein L6452_14916 [Arctium lappa]|uniref:Uncharacterized protein n=1 Tax=Arctium lappa TaxID=4217 RepID=A0ACB9CMD8_ARCLA|nr:hypothetical protein L6452_14916 [Arctium lappa]
MDKLAKLYIDEVVSRHGIPLSIVSHHDRLFYFKILGSVASRVGERKVIYRIGNRARDGRQSQIYTKALKGGTRSTKELYRKEEANDGVSSGRPCDVEGVPMEGLNTIRVDDTHCIEEPKAILERETKRLRYKEVTMVKVQWKQHRGANVTWGSEEDMKRRYPHLFV